MHENLNFFFKTMVNLLPSTQLLSSFTDSLSRHKVAAPATCLLLSRQGGLSHSSCSALVPSPAFTIHSDLQGLKSSLRSCFLCPARAPPARSTYCCILMCVHMSITGIIKGNLGSDCLCPQGRDRNICCNAYLFLIFLNKHLELFMLHCSNTHTAYKYKKV